MGRERKTALRRSRGRRRGRSRGLRAAATHGVKRANVARIAHDDLVPYLLREASSAPELWAQKSYLARVVQADGEADIVPLADWLDHSASGSKAVAVEMNAKGEIYPAVYVERGGEVREHLLAPHPLNDFEGEEYRRELSSLL